MGYTTSPGEFVRTWWVGFRQIFLKKESYAWFQGLLKFYLVMGGYLLWIAWPVLFVHLVHVHLSPLSFPGTGPVGHFLRYSVPTVFWIAFILFPFEHGARALKKDDVPEGNADHVQFIE
jgi:hypothetical protein